MNFKETKMKDFKTIWKTLAADKKLWNIHFIQRAVLIAMNSKTNVPKMDIVHGLLQKHYTPITNANKLANGSQAYSIIKNSAWYLQYCKTVLNVPMEEFFDSPEEEKLFKELIKGIDYRKLGRQYIYYFTTQEGLTAEQQGVQAGHVLFSLGVSLAKRKLDINPNETYFQWIGVKTSKDLHDIRLK